MFIVWYATFRLSNDNFAKASKDNNESFVKVSGNSNETIAKLADRTAESYNTAIKDSRNMNERLISLIRENAKEDQDIKSHLIRVLTRMEEKLDQPVRCPMNIQSQRGE